jgi:hypothetical protein
MKSRNDRSRKEWRSGKGKSGTDLSGSETLLAPDLDCFGGLCEMLIAVTDSVFLRADNGGKVFFHGNDDSADIGAECGKHLAQASRENQIKAHVDSQK